MAVINSFVQWQKDTFFFAAEEVQNSADAMSSMYSLWLRERAEGSPAEALLVIRRELQTTLGTAKWQLEEFERAVKESHRRRPGDESSAIRHNQFIKAMTEQIAQVEKELRESLVEEGKEPLRWIQLDEEERNDLALFISASAISDANSATSSDIMVKKEANEISSRTDKPSSGGWRILIAGDENREMKSSETTSHRFLTLSKLAKFAPNLKRLRSSLEKAKNLEDRPIMVPTASCSDLTGITRVSQVKNKNEVHVHDSFPRFFISLSLSLSASHGQRTKVSSEKNGSCLGDLKEDVISHLSEAHRQAPEHYMQLKRPVQLVGLLAVAMLLIVPLVLYST